MTSPLAWFPFATVVGVVPWWEPPLIFVGVVAIFAYALTGSAPEPEKSGASMATASEVMAIDRTLTGHATALLRLIAVVGAGFLAAVKIGSLSIGLVVLTLTGILVPVALGTAALALVGGPLLVRGMHEDTRADQASAATQRVYRRARVIRAATWCMIPMITLSVTCTLIAVLAQGKK